MPGIERPNCPTHVIYERASAGGDLRKMPRLRSIDVTLREICLQSDSCKICAEIVMQIARNAGAFILQHLLALEAIEAPQHVDAAIMNAKCSQDGGGRASSIEWPGLPKIWREGEGQRGRFLLP